MMFAPNWWKIRDTPILQTNALVIEWFEVCRHLGRHSWMPPHNSENVWETTTCYSNRQHSERRSGGHKSWNCQSKQSLHRPFHSGFKLFNCCSLQIKKFWFSNLFKVPVWSIFSNRKGHELQTQCDLRSPPKSIEDNFKMEKTVLVFKKEGREVVNAEGPSRSHSLLWLELGWSQISMENRFGSRLHFMPLLI